MSYKNSNWYKDMQSKAMEGFTSILENESKAILYDTYLKELEILESNYILDKANLSKNLAKQLAMISFNEASTESGELISTQ